MGEFGRMVSPSYADGVHKIVAIVSYVSTLSLDYAGMQITPRAQHAAIAMERPLASSGTTG